MIFLRRKLQFFSKAELGGKSVPKYISGTFLTSLWILFVVLVSLNAYEVIQDPFAKAWTGVSGYLNSLQTTGM